MTANAADDPILRELTAAIAGRYSVERELGRGGMGAVFLARDLRLDRPVAIKVLPPELAVRPELRERFLRETRTAASFSHPNIVSVYSVEEAPGLLYFVMSYVEGETLTQRVKRQGPLSVPEAVRLLQETAWALSYAHGRGVVHRDIKPDNILLERATGRALVMDFGIARSVAASALTQVGETVGTPHFMSPEQVAGDTVDGRSDLYSLGIVAYFAVSGRLPFEGATAQAVMMAQVSQAAVPVSRVRADLPQPLAQAIDRCLKKDPAERFATGEALVEALEQVRTRNVEVPPAIRVWTARADQFFRNGLLLAILVPQMLNVRGAGGGKALLLTTVFLAAIPTIWAQIPIGMRELARQGFGFHDLRSGVLAIDAEQAAVLAAQRADPRYHRRRRRVLFSLLGGMLLAVLMTVLALRSGQQTAAGQFKVSMPAYIVAMIGISATIVFVIAAIAALAGSARLDRRMHRLWTGRAGAQLFRLATWRLEAEPVTRAAVSGSASAATLIETLDPRTRRRLRGAREYLDRLATALSDLDRRDRELDAATQDARSTTPALATGTSDRQQALLQDLNRASQAVSERRAALAAAVENIRFAVVRVKSRIGTVEDVEREVAEAGKLLDRSGPGEGEERRKE